MDDDEIKAKLRAKFTDTARVRSQALPAARTVHGLNPNQLKNSESDSAGRG